MSGTVLGSWKRLGDIPPAELGGARRQLHWAAQVPAAAGRALAPPEHDHGHTTLSWRDGRLVGRPAPDRRRMSLDVAGLSLVLLGPDGSPAERLPLVGRSLDDAFDWAGERLGAALRRPEYDLPEDPVSGGAPFEPAGPVHEEIARWYENAAWALERLRGAEDVAGPVRCWPHHLDVATLVALDPPGLETARSINLGLSPGDGSIPEPYWYVTPWPRPTHSPLPELDAGGEWWTDGFTAGVLTASRLLTTEAAGDQAGRVMEFLRCGRAAAARLLGPV